MRLIIQIPCFNEESTLPATLADLPKKITGIDDIVILIVNDGSTDATVKIARGHGVLHIVEFGKNQGLAFAFQAGLDACLKLGADVIVNTDADNQYCGADIPKLVAPILEGKADLVVGTRDIGAIGHFSTTKKWLQRIGSWVVRRASGCLIRDTTSGFRAFNREAALRMIVHSKFSYTLETLVHAGAGPLSVEQVPIRVNEKLRESRLAGSTWVYLKKSTATLLRIYSMVNPLRVFLFIGGLVFGLGFLLGARYVYFYLVATAAGHIQSLILAAILMIVGFQTMVIGLVADLIGANRRLSEEILYRLRKFEIGGSQKSDFASDPPQQTAQTVQNRR